MPDVRPRDAAGDPSAAIRTDWHDRSVDQTVRELETDLRAGLSDAEATNRLRRFGPNERA
ncbi:cation-transporting P-type ATPase [Microbacterium sp. Marseille-Q6648]|uniref:cation-transporting P-type ATPase n=1 Tax=Microbacterium sp. Marseille-Q6648 TaxID=2937991 RepID=UPI003335DC2F